LLEGLLKALPTISVGVLPLCAGVGLIHVWDLPSMPNRWEDMSAAHLTTTCLLALWLLSVVLAVSIATVGRPRTLIPPGMRDSRKRPRNRGARR
jgi:hypothetical protein